MLQGEAAPARRSACRSRPNGDNEELFTSTQWRLQFCKVIPCTKRHAHDWAQCPFAHPRDAARRRDPSQFTYTGIACPNMKQDQRCSLGDQCPFAHNVFEYWLHPSRYRTQPCNDGENCRRWLCFFAHNDAELRKPDFRPWVPTHEMIAAAATEKGVGMPQLRDASLAMAAQLPPMAQQQAQRAAAPGGVGADSLQALAVALTRQQQQADQQQGATEVVALVMRLLACGSMSAETTAAVLRQLLPPDTLRLLQGQLLGQEQPSVAMQPRSYSDQLGFDLAGRPLVPPAAANVRGSLDSAAFGANSIHLGWTPQPTTQHAQHAAPPTRLSGQYHNPQEAALQLEQLAALQLAGGGGASLLNGTAAARLRVPSGLAVGRGGASVAAAEMAPPPRALLDSPPSGSELANRSAAAACGGSSSTPPSRCSVDSGWADAAACAAAAGVPVGAADLQAQLSGLLGGLRLGGTAAAGEQLLWSG